MLLLCCHELSSDLWLQSPRTVSLGWQLAGPVAELRGFPVLVTTAGTADRPLASSLMPQFTSGRQIASAHSHHPDWRRGPPNSQGPQDGVERLGRAGVSGSVLTIAAEQCLESSVFRRPRGPSVSWKPPPAVTRVL